MAVFEAEDPDLLDLLAAFTARAAKASAGAPPRRLEDAMSEMRTCWTPTLDVGTVAKRAEFIRFISRAAFVAGSEPESAKSCGAHGRASLPRD